MTTLTARRGPIGPRRCGPLTPTQKELAARYVPLAVGMARRAARGWARHRDDFEGIAQVALVQAARSFDPGRHVKFPTFAAYRITGAMADARRALTACGFRRDPRAAPAVGPLRADSEGAGRVLMNTPDAPVGAGLDGADTVERRLRCLPRKYAAVCRELYVLGRTEREAAGRLGLSPSRVNQVHRLSLAIMRG